MPIPGFVKQYWLKLHMTKHHGFSLLELMMTLAIAVIMLTMAVPSYVSFTKNTKVTSQINTLAASINLARGEAGKRGMRVVFCNSSDPTAASPSCSNTAQADWSTGWLIYAVNGLDAEPLYGGRADDVLIAATEGEDGLDIMTLAAETKKTLEFNADGSTNEDGNTIVFAFCDNRGVSKGKTLSIRPTGHASVADATTCTPS